MLVLPSLLNQQVFNILRPPPYESCVRMQHKFYNAVLVGLRRDQISCRQFLPLFARKQRKTPLLVRSVNIVTQFFRTALVGRVKSGWVRRKRASNYRKPLTQKFYTPPVSPMLFYYCSPAKVLFFLGRNTRYLGEAPLNGLGQTASSLLPYLAWGFGGRCLHWEGGGETRRKH